MSARLTASSPVLLVRDVVKAADHYRDALHAEFVRRGAKVDYGLCDQFYLDGHDIGFGQVAKEPA